MTVPHTLEDLYPSCTHKLALFQELFAQVRHLPGDFAEFGVFNGNGTRELASLDPTRTAWAFDTFDGMPAEDYNEDEDSSDPPGKWKPNGEPTALFEGIPNVRVVQGRFADTLPQVDPDVRYLLVHIDCDWYQSHMQVLTFLEWHLTPGAMLVLDDPNLPGANRALREWTSKMGPRVSWDGDRALVWHG